MIVACRVYRSADLFIYRLQKVKMENAEMKLWKIQRIKYRRFRSVKTSQSRFTL